MLAVGLCVGCGGADQGAPPMAPSPPPSTGEALEITLGTTTARFAADINGGPGSITYSLCQHVHVPREFWSRTVTIQHVEYSALGADGTVYRSVRDLQGQTFGAVGTTGRTACTPGSFEDTNIARPPAHIYHARAEYSVDGDPPDRVRVLTAEKAIEATVPALPMMTRLSLTSDLPVPPILNTFRPMTFVARGEGGAAPYEYQFREGNNVVLRDWSPSPTFEWDGSAPGRPSRHGTRNVVALARSRGGTDPEVKNYINVTLTFD